MPPLKTPAGNMSPEPPPPPPVTVMVKRSESATSAVFPVQVARKRHNEFVAAEVGVPLNEPLEIESPGTVRVETPYRYTAAPDEAVWSSFTRTVVPLTQRTRVGV